MARRKKSRKSTGRRRKMGAVGGLDIKTPAFAALGAVGGTYLINGPMKTSSFVGPGAIVLGLFLPKFVKSETAKAFGTGLVAAGAISLMQNAGVISGVRRMGRVIVNGPGSPISSVAGVPPSVQRKQVAAEIQRRQSAGANRVIMGANANPISSVAGFDPCDL